MAFVAGFVGEDFQELVIHAAPAFFPVVGLVVFRGGGSGAESGEGLTLLVLGIALAVAVPGVELHKGIPEVVVLAVEGLAFLIEREGFVSDLVEPDFASARLGPCGDAFTCLLKNAEWKSSRPSRAGTY